MYKISFKRASFEAAKAQGALLAAQGATGDVVKIKDENGKTVLKITNDGDLVQYSYADGRKTAEPIEGMF